MSETSRQIEALQAEVARLTTALEGERSVSRRAEDRLSQYVRELERSNAELEQFAYAASHDLQEPLRMVAQFSGLLRDHLRAGHPSVLAEEEVTLYLGHLTNGSDRAKKLIDGLLAYSRVGRQAEFGPLRLDDALDDAIELLNGAVAESGTTITRATLPAVWGDRSMVGRVFLNLLTNAMRFARDGEPARVHVSAESDGHEVTVAVSDNGIGIEPRHAERIFGLFQRLNPEKHGTGLGLAICKKIVEKHGGRIWVESALGRGATFKLTVPATEPSSTGS